MGVARGGRGELVSALLETATAGALLSGHRGGRPSICDRSAAMWHKPETVVRHELLGEHSCARTRVTHDVLAVGRVWTDASGAGLGRGRHKTRERRGRAHAPTSVNQIITPHGDSAYSGVREHGSEHQGPATQR